MTKFCSRKQIVHLYMLNRQSVATRFDYQNRLNLNIYLYWKRVGFNRPSVGYLYLEIFVILLMLLCCVLTGISIVMVLKREIPTRNVKNVKKNGYLLSLFFFKFNSTSCLWTSEFLGRSKNFLKTYDSDRPMRSQIRPINLE